MMKKVKLATVKFVYLCHTFRTVLAHIHFLKMKQINKIKKTQVQKFDLLVS